jgi:hypothetical protein
MSGSLYNSQRSDGTGFKLPSGPAVQAGVLVAISLATIVCVDWAIGASRSKVATRSEAAAPAPANCPQAAETFDSQRAACLRRRWSAMRDMKPWPNASGNAVLEDCLRSSRGDTVVPFRANTCGDDGKLARQD